MKQQTKTRGNSLNNHLSLSGLSMNQRHPIGYHDLWQTPPISTQPIAICSIAFSTVANSTENSEEP
jgi:hypothetical protein